jgi:hypothetical protein
MPLMGSRGGGSIRGFGRFGKSLLLAFIDSFTRGNGDLGTSSDGKASWKSVVGTFAISSNKANSSDSPGISVVDMDGTNITNIQADTTGGTGVAFWVQDSSNYYALYPTYSSNTVSGSNCNAPGGSGSSVPAGKCGVAGSSCGQWYNYCGYNGQNVPTGDTGSCGGRPSNWPGILDNNCGPGWYYTGCKCASYTWSGTTVSYSTTTYYSTAKLLKVQGGSSTDLVSTDYYANTGGYSTTNSVAVSTSGSTITYAFYSSTNKGGSVLASGTNTPSSPVKGVGAGVFRTASSTNQGNDVSNFSVTVTP